MSETLPSIFETGLGKLSDILSRVDRGHICATVTKGHFTQTLLYWHYIRLPKSAGI